MSKADRDRRFERGQKLLSEWGIDATADAQRLRGVLGRDADADLAVATRLGGIAEGESVAVLRALEDTAADKLVRREAKRSLYRLQQKGVAVERPRPEPPRLTAGPAGIEGYLSSVDGRGDQMVWLVRPVAGGALHLFAVVNDPEGLKEIELAEVSRKTVRGLREELARKHQIRLVEADWRYCDFVIDRAFHWAGAHGESAGDYPRLRSQLTAEPVVAMEPLIYRHLEREAVRADAASLADSHALLQEQELRTWILERDALRPYLEELAAVRDSPLMLTEQQQRERFAGIVARALDQLLGGEKRSSWQRRLEEMAYFFHATGRPEQAKKALAAALALGAREGSGHEIPFFEALCRFSLLAHWQLEDERREKESQTSLILTPQQAMREAAARRLR